MSNLKSVSARAQHQQNGLFTAWNHPERSQGQHRFVVRGYHGSHQEHFHVGTHVKTDTLIRSPLVRARGSLINHEKCPAFPADRRHCLLVQ